MPALPACRLRGLLLIAGLVCAADWTLKAGRGGLWSGWVPHPSQPDLLLLAVTVCGCALLVWVLPGVCGLVGGGLVAGGCLANQLDVLADGVAWNMIPVVGTDSWCNLADVAIVAGAGLLIISAVPMSVRLLTRPAAG